MLLQLRLEHLEGFNGLQKSTHKSCRGQNMFHVICLLPCLLHPDVLIDMPLSREYPDLIHDHHLTREDSVPLNLYSVEHSRMNDAG